MKCAEFMKTTQPKRDLKYRLNNIFLQLSLAKMRTALKKKFTPSCS